MKKNILLNTCEVAGSGSLMSKNAPKLALEVEKHK
jgi:hypothetical protein